MPPSAAGTAPATPANLPVDRVRRLAAQVAEFTAERDAAIVRASRSGASRASIARAAGLDDGTVQRIVARAAAS